MTWDFLRSFFGKYFGQNLGALKTDFGIFRLIFGFFEVEYRKSVFFFCRPAPKRSIIIWIYVENLLYRDQDFFQKNFENFWENIFISLVRTKIHEAPKHFRNMAKPSNWKNNVFENINAVFCCSTRDQLNQIFFRFALKPSTAQTSIFSAIFADE